MKRFVLLTALVCLCVMNAAAQDDDLYYTPSKKVKAANKAAYEKAKAEEEAYERAQEQAYARQQARAYEQIMSTQYSGSTRDVDEYNRRYYYNGTANTSANTSGSASGNGMPKSYYTVIGDSTKALRSDSIGNDVIAFNGTKGYYPDSQLRDSMATDYKYSRRMERFDGARPQVNIYINNDPWYWSSWRSPWYWSSWYDPWFDDPWYWGTRWGWGSYYSSWGWGVSFHTGWYGPRWYGPRWYGGWGIPVRHVSGWRPANGGGRYDGYRPGGNYYGRPNGNYYGRPGGNYGGNRPNTMGTNGMNGRFGSSRTSTSQPNYNYGSQRGYNSGSNFSGGSRGGSSFGGGGFGGGFGGGSHGGFGGGGGMRGGGGGGRR